MPIVTYGPYSEYAPAQERAIRMQTDGRHSPGSIKIKKTTLPESAEPGTFRGGDAWFIEAFRYPEDGTRATVNGQPVIWRGGGWFRP